MNLKKKSQYIIILQNKYNILTIFRILFGQYDGNLLKVNRRKIKFPKYK